MYVAFDYANAVMVMTDLVDRKVQDADDFIGVAEVKGTSGSCG